ncbi:hypothetical protein [Lentzea sp. HUAS12]|uniref:hypothetical protein n=1 Tax=Lentzea sp. HUAS12 TaxID=2951806 RepID=UPI00209CAEA3|nr:hypothetical protein [Lentzea sp. HUAS12]USX49913.1 hypothetical protein ND450_31555 [Lentzea sp. HUAS12]
MLPLAQSVEATLRSWSKQLRGHDIHAAFVQSARLRLVIAALERHHRRGDQTLVPPTVWRRSFGRLHTGDGLAALNASRRFYGHILLNPPFGLDDGSGQPTWSTGKTSQAAVFMAAAAECIRAGGQVTAILPDVLRSGSRYRAWRSHIESLVKVERVDRHGIFDSHTDVDVFYLQAAGQQSDAASAMWWPKGEATKVIGEVFDVRVGTVVDNRDPHDGPLVPYLTARDLGKATEMTTIDRERRFAGKLIKPPFVVVRRTSRPGEMAGGGGRIAGVLVLGDREVAVDNHLITLKALGTRPGPYRKLLRILGSAATTNFLDERIRCRHLTVTAVRSLPWAGK